MRVSYKGKMVERESAFLLLLLPLLGEKRRVEGKGERRGEKVREVRGRRKENNKRTRDRRVIFLPLCLCGVR